MKPFCILLTSLLTSMAVTAQMQAEPAIITYSLDEGNLDATDYDHAYFAPEPLHAHNVTMEPIVFNGLDGVFSNGWEEGGEYDTTQYLHLRVNINAGHILHLDSVTFTGTGVLWDGGPIIGGTVIFDTDTLCGSTVGWQIGDTVLYCVSTMWYSYPIWDEYLYTWHDTLVNWWQINSSTHLDIHLIAWGNVPDTLGNYVPSAGWVVDHIQLHGKVFADLSTTLSELPPLLDLTSIGDKPVEIYDVQGQKVSDRLSYLETAIPGMYVVRQNGMVKKVMKKE